MSEKYKGKIEKGMQFIWDAPLDGTLIYVSNIFINKDDEVLITTKDRTGHEVDFSPDVFRKHAVLKAVQND